MNFEPGFLKRAAIDISKIPDIMYHGSPDKLESLGGDRDLFLTPHKGIASLFTLDKKELRKLLGNPKSSSLGYKQWKLSVEELQDILEEISITHSEEGVPQGKGMAKGFIYSVDVSKLKEKLKDFANNPNQNRELVYSGPAIQPKDIMDTEIPFTYEYSPKEKVKLQRMLRGKS